MNNKATIAVSVKEVWGNARYYPENETACSLLQIMKRKSFTAQQIKKLSKFFTINFLENLHVKKIADEILNEKNEIQ